MSDKAGIQFDNINDFINMIPKKGGRKRSKKGGVWCSICGKPMADGSFERGKEYHTLCKIQQKQRTKNRRDDQRARAERDTRKHARRAKSPFRFRIKKPVGANGEVRKLTPQEEALNSVLKWCEVVEVLWIQTLAMKTDLAKTRPQTFQYIFHRLSFKASFKWLISSKT